MSVFVTIFLVTGCVILHFVSSSNSNDVLGEVKRRIKEINEAVISLENRNLTAKIRRVEKKIAKSIKAFDPSKSNLNNEMQQKLKKLYAIKAEIVLNQIQKKDIAMTKKRLEKIKEETTKQITKTEEDLLLLQTREKAIKDNGCAGYKGKNIVDPEAVFLRNHLSILETKLYDEILQERQERLILRTKSDFLQTIPGRQTKTIEKYSKNPKTIETKLKKYLGCFKIKDELHALRTEVRSMIGEVRELGGELKTHKDNLIRMYKDATEC